MTKCYNFNSNSIDKSDGVGSNVSCMTISKLYKNTLRDNQVGLLAITESNEQ